MKPTSWRDLLVVAVVAAFVGNVLIRVGYAAMPQIPLLAGSTLGVLGIAEAVAGNALRARIRRRPGARPVQPLVAARAVLVAKASALAGAVMTGVWVGLLGHVLPRAGVVTAAASDSAAAAVGVVCALGLVAGALWLEHSCRTPDDRDDGDGGPGATHP